VAQAAAVAGAIAAGRAGGVPLAGGPPPPLVVLPPGLPSPMSLAIWSKKLEAERAAFSALEMRNCCMVRWEGKDPKPGALVLVVATGHRSLNVSLLLVPTRGLRSRRSSS
jgi:hypothetical protein